MRVKSKRVPDGYGGWKIERQVVAAPPVYEGRPEIIPKIKPDCYVVMGSIRGGTTLTAGILQHLGVWMGPTEEFHTHGDNRVSGYFEHLGFKHLFFDLAIDYYKTKKTDYWWDAIRPEHPIPPINGRHLQWFITLVKEAEQYPAWGIKVFPIILYWRLFTQACFSNIHVIKVNRGVNSVAKSIDSAVHYSPKHIPDIEVARGWYAMRERALLDDCPRRTMTIDFENIVANPVWAVETLADFTKRTPTQAAVDFINPKYKHY